MPLKKVQDALRESHRRGKCQGGLLRETCFYMITRVSQRELRLYQAEKTGYVHALKRTELGKFEEIKGLVIEQSELRREWHKAGMREQQSEVI